MRNVLCVCGVCVFVLANGHCFGADDEQQIVYRQKDFKLGHYILNVRVTEEGYRKSKWRPDDENPPLSAGKAIAIADKYNDEVRKKVGKTIFGGSHVPIVQRASLVPIAIPVSKEGGKPEVWIWAIRYEWCPPPEDHVAVLTKLPRHEVWVLMNGDVLPFEYKLRRKAKKSQE